MSKENIFPVAVIGGGLAGLTATAHLAARGLTPVLLEADSLWPGGRLSGGEPESFAYKEQVWMFKPDQGVHAVWNRYDNMRATLDRFLDVHLQPSWGEEWINCWGRKVTALESGNAVRSPWIPAPFHYAQLLFYANTWRSISLVDLLSVPGILASILLTVGFDPIREKNPLPGLMMDDYFLGWTRTMRAIFVGLGINMLAAPADKINLAAFIACMRFYTMLRSDAWSLDYFPGNTHDNLIQPFIDKIRELDGSVILGAEVDCLQQVDGGWKISFEDSESGGRRSLIANQVILAVDPGAAQRILMQSPSTAAIASQMVFPEALENATVKLWFDASPRPGAPGGMFTGDFMLDNFFWFHRLYDEYRVWHDETGGSAIEMHIYGPDNVLELPDKNLLVNSVAEVQRAFPELRGHFVHGVVRRNIRSQTNFIIPTDHSLFVESPWPGISACGDWIGYINPALWMERATITGIAAANRVIESHGLEPWPIIPPHKPEPLVRILALIIRVFRVILGPPISWLFRRLRGRKQSRG